MGKGTPSLPHCEIVHAEPLDWLAPGIHRLWLGEWDVLYQTLVRLYFAVDTVECKIYIKKNCPEINIRVQ